MTTVQGCPIKDETHIHLDGVCEFETERLEMEGILPIYDEEE